MASPIWIALYLLGTGRSARCRKEAQETNQYVSSVYFLILAGPLTGSPRFASQTEPGARALQVATRRTCAVLRNNVAEKLTLPLPIHTRDASRRGSVWQSRVKQRRFE